MSQYPSLGTARITTNATAKDSITISIVRSSPKPATPSAALIDLRPETRLDQRAAVNQLLHVAMQAGAEEEPHASTTLGISSHVRPSNCRP